MIPVTDGGSDPGAVNALTGLRECDVALEVCLTLERMIQGEGFECMLTRVKDVDVAYPDASAGDELGARCQVANEWGADLFVSVHCDSFSNPDAHGTTTFYSSPTGAKLADSIQDSLVAELHRRDRGIKSEPFYVLRRTNMTAVLVELAFISNPEEEALLADSDFQYRSAVAIWRGVKGYLGINTLPPQDTPLESNPTQSDHVEQSHDMMGKDDWSDVGLRNKGVV